MSLLLSVTGGFINIWAMWVGKRGAGRRGGGREGGGETGEREGACLQSVVQMEGEAEICLPKGDFDLQASTTATLTMLDSYYAENITLAESPQDWMAGGCTAYLFIYTGNEHSPSPPAHPQQPAAHPCP